MNGVWKKGLCLEQSVKQTSDRETEEEVEKLLYLFKCKNGQRKRTVIHKIDNGSSK